MASCSGRVLAILLHLAALVATPGITGAVALAYPSSHRSLLQDGGPSGPPTGGAPLRLKWQLFDAGMPEGHVKLLNEVLPRAQRALQRAFNVLAPVEGRLQVPRDCARFLVEDPNKCTEVGSFCGLDDVPTPISIPEEIFLPYQQCSSNGQNCTAAGGGEGVEGADIWVAVYSQETERCKSGTVAAYARSCSLDDAARYGAKNRPLSGAINFCPSNVEESAQATRTDWLVDTAVHEMLHVLFMSSNLFEKYIDDSGAVRTGVLEGRTLVTPAVTAAVQAHFGCDSANGASLEDEGGEGTEGSHWEASIFLGEVMAASGSTGLGSRRVLSTISMSAAQDSGWYSPDYTAAGFLITGYQQGCDALGACTDRSKIDSAYVCTPGEGTPAGGDGSASDVCISPFESGTCTVPEGDNTTTNGCPIPQGYLNGNCQLPYNLPTAFDNATSAEQIGVFYGADAMCIPVASGNLTRRWPPQDPGAGTLGYGALSVLCIKAKCGGDALAVAVPDGQGADAEVACPEGGMAALGPEQGYPAGTQLGPCPSKSDVCRGVGCPQGNGTLCSDAGTCFDGACYCAADASGPDCSLALCGGSGDCPSGYECNERAVCIEGDGIGAQFDQPVWVWIVIGAGVLAGLACACYCGITTARRARRGSAARAGPTKNGQSRGGGGGVANGAKGGGGRGAVAGDEGVSVYEVSDEPDPEARGSTPNGAFVSALRGAGAGGRGGRDFLGRPESDFVDAEAEVIEVGGARGKSGRGAGPAAGGGRRKAGGARAGRGPAAGEGARFDVIDVVDPGARSAAAMAALGGRGAGADPLAGPAVPPGSGSGRVSGGGTAPRGAAPRLPGLWGFGAATGAAQAPAKAPAMSPAAAASAPERPGAAGAQPLGGVADGGGWEGSGPARRDAGADFRAAKAKPNAQLKASFLR